MPRLTRFKCVSCKRTIVVLSTNGNATLRVACEDCETEMRKDGFANISTKEVPALRTPLRTNLLPQCHSQKTPANC